MERMLLAIILVTWQITNAARTINDLDDDDIDSFNQNNSRGCKLLKPYCPQNSSDIGFYLYTSNDEPEIITYEEIEKAPFIPGAPVKILIHGYNSNRNKTPNVELIPEYMKAGNYNVIAVDWARYGTGNFTLSCYYEATLSIMVVANCTNQLINGICTRRPDINCTDIHLIGHSLGVQCAARVGALSRWKYKRTITRITGLEPSRPLYNSYYGRAFTIDKTDALQVDITHTNSGKYGMAERCGTVDYYINGGFVQPSCNQSESVLSTCDHKMSAKYYAATINVHDENEEMYGYHCPLAHYVICNCNAVNDSGFVKYGEHIPRNITGFYVVETNDSPPYGKGKNQTQCDE